MQFCSYFYNFSNDMCLPCVRSLNVCFDTTKMYNFIGTTPIVNKFKTKCFNKIGTGNIN